MNTVFFTGNVGSDAEVKSVNGTDVANFSVAVRQGFQRDAPTEWYRVAVWGQRANSIAPHIKKGGKVAVCGDLSLTEYNGKLQVNIRAHDVDPFMSRREDGPAPQRQAAPAVAYDDDDSTPF